MLTCQPLQAGQSGQDPEKVWEESKNIMSILKHIHRKHMLPRAACVFLVMLIMPVTAMARFADHLEVRNIPNTSFGVWIQAGSVSARARSCISSASDDSPRPRGWFAWQMPYQVKVADLGGGGDFYLYLDGDTSNTGNRRIGISLSHRDLHDGGAFEILSHNAYDSHSHVGSFRNCLQNGDNSELRINITGNELNGKVSGYYTGTFSLTAIGGVWGSATDSDTFTVDITIQARPEVMISRLDNLNLGTHSGLGDIYAEERFCVYSSSGGGSYNMTISSTNQDGGGNFFLDGALGQIPYDLDFIDQGSGPGTTSVGSGTLSGFGNSADPDCNGSNNATLSVFIRERDLQRSKSGTYSDRLTILVEPQ